MTNNTLTALFKKLLIIIVVLIVVDFTVGKVLEHFYLRMKGVDSAAITYAMNDAKEDVLIFGSSRGRHHYIPSIIEDSTMLTAYNCGMSAQFMIYHYCVLRSVLRRTTPKVIVLDIVPTEFDRTTTAMDHLSHLLPYYRSHEEIRDIIDKRSRFEKIKALSNLYCYNSRLMEMLDAATDDTITSEKGYVSLSGVYKGPLTYADDPGSDTTTDSLKINYFLSFIKDAQKAKCKVFVFVSPIYKKFSRVPITIKLAKQICSQLGVSFFDYSESPISLQRQFFADRDHLNNDGAIMYSKIVAGEIAKALKR